VGTLAQAALLHSGRPTVVTVGVGAETVVPAGTEGTTTLGHALTVDTPLAQHRLGTSAAESTPAAP
jgi:hypothetical protein